jgi:hypothetical protein
MFDLLTVVFRDELSVLQVQAQSIDLYCQDIGIQRIFVIVNDDDCVADQINPAWWGSLKNHVTVVKRSRFDAEFVDDGWVSQQALKLIGSALSDNEYTIVLDAKTIFAQELVVSNVINERGQLCVGTIPVPEVFKASKEITNNLFETNLTHVIGPSGVPFWFNNKLLKAMILYIENCTKQNFANWFQEQGMLTEFILYSGFVLRTYQTFDDIVTQRYYQVQNICHSEVARFDQKYNDMQSAKILAVSVHRNAWLQLNQEQKQKYVDFLVSRNITSAIGLL